MIENCEECSRFDTIRDLFVDKARMILKKGWFSYVEVLELYQNVNSEEYQQDLTT